jgi:hypothetical protein
MRSYIESAFYYNGPHSLPSSLLLAISFKLGGQTTVYFFQVLNLSVHTYHGCGDSLELTRLGLACWYVTVSAHNGVKEFIKP